MVHLSFRPLSYSYRVRVGYDTGKDWWRVAAVGDVVLGDLTFNFQAVEDVYSYSINLQLTGALLLHLI